MKNKTDDYKEKIKDYVCCYIVEMWLQVENSLDVMSNIFATKIYGKKLTQEELNLFLEMEAKEVSDMIFQQYGIKAVGKEVFCHCFDMKIDENNKEKEIENFEMIILNYMKNLSEKIKKSMPVKPKTLQEAVENEIEEKKILLN